MKRNPTSRLHISWNGSLANACLRRIDGADTVGRARLAPPLSFLQSECAWGGFHNSVLSSLWGNTYVCVYVCIDGGLEDRCWHGRINDYKVQATRKSVMLSRRRCLGKNIWWPLWRYPSTQLQKSERDWHNLLHLASQLSRQALSYWRVRSFSSHRHPPRVVTGFWVNLGRSYTLHAVHTCRVMHLCS